MSLDLYSEHGYVGPLASNKGWSDVLAAFEGTEDKTIRWFMGKGYTERPALLADRIEKWEREPRNGQPVAAKGVEETVKNLVGMLRKTPNLAIVWDGVGAEPGTEHLDELRERPRAKLKRDTETPYWDSKVLAAETHIDFRSLDRLRQHSEDRLAKLLKGKARARVIRQVAQQAVQQKQGGRLPSEMTFGHSHDLQAEVRAELRRVYDLTRKLTREEIARQVGKRK